MTARQRVLALIAAGTTLRLALGAAVGPSVDESYAVVMGRRLALSYYDHPPLLFWIPGLAARLAGSEAQLVVRLPFVLMFAGTTWFVYRLGALLFGEDAGFLASLTLNLVLFFSLCAGAWVLPDGPLLFFSAAAAICLTHALGLERADGSASIDPAPARERPWWPGFGLCAGLAMLSKYHGVFLLIGTAAFLLTSPRHRPWLRRPEPYLAGALALIVFSPVLFWNASHAWASFRFQGGRATAAVARGGSPLLDTIAGQAAWMLPWLWVPLLGVLVGALRRCHADPRRWLLVCLGVGPIAVFTLLAALGQRGLPHWSAPGYFMLLPALGRSLQDRLARGERVARRWLWAGVVGLALVLGLLVSQLRGGWIDRLAPQLVARGDPTDDLLQWRQPVLTGLAAWGYPRAGVTIAGSDWVDAAKLAYALGPAVRVVSVGDDVRGFEYVSSQRSLVGQDMLLIARRSPHRTEPMIAYSAYFMRLVPLGLIQVGPPESRGVTLGVYLGRNLLEPLPQKRRP